MTRAAKSDHSIMDGSIVHDTPQRELPVLFPLSHIQPKENMSIEGLEEERESLKCRLVDAERMVKIERTQREEIMHLLKTTE
jgi:hypothetical protein